MINEYRPLSTVLMSAFKSCLTFGRDPKKRLGFIGIILLLLIFVIWGMCRSAHIDTSTLNELLDPAEGVRFFGKDFFADWPNNSYTAFSYTVMSVLTPFNRWFASFLWGLMNISFIIGTIAIITEMIAKTQPGKTSWSYLTAPFLCTIFIGTDIFMGQTTPVTMFITLCALYQAMAGRDIIAGQFLGAVIAFKAIPLIFLYYFILKMRVKLVVSTLAGIFICMLFIPMLVFGPQKTIESFQKWNSMVLVPLVKGTEIQTTNIDAYHTNQSLDAFFERHFTDYGERRYGGLHKYIDPNTFTKSQALMFSKIIKILLVLLMTYIAIRFRGLQSRTFPFEISIIFTLMLFISPISWVSYYAFVLLGYVVAVNEIKELPKNHPGRKPLLVSLIIAVIIMHLGWGNYLQSFSVFFIGQLIFFCTFVWYTIRYASDPNRSIKQSLK